MYIITARRMTSGELLKYRKGLFMTAGYGSFLSGSSQFSLTKPRKGLFFIYADFENGLFGSSGFYLTEPCRVIPSNSKCLYK